MPLGRTAAEAWARPIRPYTRKSLDAIVFINARSVSSYLEPSPAACRRSIAPSSIYSRPINQRLTRPIYEDNVSSVTQSLKTQGHRLYMLASKSNVLGRMSLDTFMHLADRIIKEAYANPPTAQAAKRISLDVNAVFDAAHVLSSIDKRIFSWALAATFAAGAVLPTILDAVRYINVVQVPMKTAALNRVEEWATQDKIPQAIIAHVKALGKREHYDEALALLNELMKRTYPTKLQPSGRNDVTLNGELEAPWELHAWLTERTGDTESTDRMLKMAALEYQDPGALVEYAQVMKQQDNLEVYEECMNKAATSGNAQAVRKLANFYYLTSLGSIVTREERSEARNGFIATFSRLFGQSRSKDDYRNLAKEWFELASLYGDHKATFFLAVLARQDGESELGLKYLAKVEKSNRLPRAVKQLRDNWNNPEYQFLISERLLKDT